MDLIKFPEIMKEIRVIVEFQDCLLQCNDLVSYEILNQGIV
jgi:hypothetical protein